MAKFHALLFLAGMVYACRAFVQVEPSSRIVGGNPTNIQDYPYVVQIEARRVIVSVWSTICAGNILTSTYILSAAHCFEGAFYNPNERRVRAGATERAVGGQVIVVEASTNHPSWSSLGNEADISVVRLSSPLQYNPVIQPVTIVSQGWKVPDNIPVVSVGWGKTEEGGDLTDILQEVNLFTVNNELCRERYANSEEFDPQIVTENMICAGILDEGGKGLCEYDSGGPLYYDKYLIGIISFSNGCARSQYPGVTIAVSSYTDWILEQVYGTS